jgi:hypothetical protein
MPQDVKHEYMLRVVCPECDSTVDFGGWALGDKLECPCGRKFRVVSYGGKHYD